MQGDAFACYQTDFRPLLRPILLRVIPVETRNSRYTAEPLRHGFRMWPGNAISIHHLISKCDD